MLASGSYDQSIKLWDVTSSHCLATLEGHTGRVWSLTFSPDGRLLASSGNDQGVKVWDVRTGECLSTLYVNGRLDACAFHPDGEHIVAAGAGGVYFLRWVR